MQVDQHRRSNSSKKKPQKQPESRTKFDVWLEGHIGTAETVKFTFKQHPFDPDWQGAVVLGCSIFQVDRYQIFIEVAGGENLVDTRSMWVSKDNIIGAE